MPAGEDGNVKPLAPGLYQLLDRRFGAVSITNQGEPFQAKSGLDYSGRPRNRVLHGGEYYCVNCPFCNDTRRRLYVNHRYGSADPQTGYPMTWLAHCFNEDCIDDNIRRHQLEGMIFGYMNRDQRGRATRVATVDVESPALKPVPWPGLVTPLHRLGPRHSAIRYVSERGFDPAVLGEQYGVGYCEQADTLYPAVQSRIIIPIYMDGMMVGWQGRYIGDVNWKSSGIRKYYNLPGMPKRLILYNLDAAKLATSRVVVLVEGATSTWTLGSESVSLLGKTISASQSQRLVASWGMDGLVVIILDPDAEKEASQVEAQLFPYFDRRAFRVTLPPGKDPADYEPDIIWDVIATEAMTHGHDLGNYRNGRHRK